MRFGLAEMFIVFLPRILLIAIVVLLIVIVVKMFSKKSDNGNGNQPVQKVGYNMNNDKADTTNDSKADIKEDTTDK